MEDMVIKDITPVKTQTDIKKYRKGEEDFSAIDSEVSKLIEDSIKYAEESPYPSPEELATDVYVSY